MLSKPEFNGTSSFLVSSYCFLVSALPNATAFDIAIPERVETFPTNYHLKGNFIPSNYDSCILSRKRFFRDIFLRLGKSKNSSHFIRN